MNHNVYIVFKYSFHGMLHCENNLQPLKGGQMLRHNQHGGLRQRSESGGETPSSPTTIQRELSFPFWGVPCNPQDTLFWSFPGMVLGGARRTGEGINIF